RASHLKRKFGITLADYEAMLVAQGGGCAICGDPEPEGRSLHVDHDHEDGQVRGLLCFRCNNALGDLREDVALLSRAASYLDSSPDDADPVALARARALALRAGCRRSTPPLRSTIPRGPPCRLARRCPSDRCLCSRPAPTPARRSSSC